jgi:hypothetical protein
MDPMRKPAQRWLYSRFLVALWGDEPDGVSLPVYALGESSALHNFSSVASKAFFQYTGSRMGVVDSTGGFGWALFPTHMAY